LDGIVFIAMFLVIIAAVAIFGHMARVQRRKALSAWASSRSLSFDAGNFPGIDECHGEFELFRQGSNRYAYNLMQGAWNNRDALAFDYHYETYSHSKRGRQTHHHYFSAVIIGSAIRLKPLLIRPEGFFDKVGEFIGFDDIDFESAEFSRAFFVKSPDRKWAYDVLHQRSMEFLLGQPRFTLQFGSNQVVISGGSTFSAQQFDSALDLGNGLLDRLPEFLLREQSEQA
jgi:hypothetical protein